VPFWQSQRIVSVKRRCGPLLLWPGLLTGHPPDRQVSRQQAGQRFLDVRDYALTPTADMAAYQKALAFTLTP
jgi:hypothetical protein